MTAEQVAASEGVVPRTFAVLEALTRSPEPMRLSALTLRLGLQKSTVHRILAGLIGLGYVQQTAETGCYSATLKLWELADHVGHQIRLGQLRGFVCLRYQGGVTQLFCNCLRNGTHPRHALTLAAHVTVGHQAMLHGCSVGEGSLIGIQAVVLNGAVIGAHSLVGAGAIVTEGKQFPPRSLILGAPAKLVRTLSDEEVAGLLQSAASYVERAMSFRQELQRID